MHLTDTHCHLDFNSFDDDRAEVLSRALQAGVMRILNPGVDLESSEAAVRLAESEAQIYAAVGVHPNEAESWQEGALSALERLSRRSKVVAIGEIGLDYYRNRARRETQQRVLHQQLDLAADRNLPVIIHNRNADDDIIGILCEWQERLEKRAHPLAQRPGVLHSYSGELAAARMAIAHHFMIGVTGPITFHNANALRGVISQVPLENILIETDAPFLAPHPKRGERNEPALVKLVAEKLAELFHLPLATVAEQTSSNARRVFQW